MIVCLVSMVAGAFDVVKFLGEPSWEGLDLCRKDDLLLATQLELDVGKQIC